MNEKRSIVIQEPSVIEETEKMLKAYYEYKSQDGIFIGLLGNNEIQDIIIPEQVKNSPDFEQKLILAINEAISYVTKSNQREIMEMLLGMEDE